MACFLERSAEQQLNKIRYLQAYKGNYRPLATDLKIKKAKKK